MNTCAARKTDTRTDRMSMCPPPPGVDLTVDEVLAATGGSRLSGHGGAVFRSVTIDSRRFDPGALFVAIRGETHDGHTFVSDVIRQGTGGIVIDAAGLAGLPALRQTAGETPVIVVADTTRALGDLAAYVRRRANVRVVAITGSNGKTTTRRMTAAAFGCRYCTLASQGNFNNDIGLPLTLFRLTPAHQWAVLEMGMNHFGEIRRLSGICRPDVGVITNIGPCHLEGVGSIEGVAAAKAEMLENICPGGTIVLNRDDHRLAELGTRTPVNVLFFGESERADVRAREIHDTGDGIDFILELPGDRAQVRLPVMGRFMVANALAAAAAGYLAGMPADAIATGLAQYRSKPGRLNIIRTARDMTIIDDTYNANPASVAAALHTLMHLARGHRAVFVMGDMLELGDAAEQHHHHIGELAAQAGVARLYVTGVHADTVSAGARAGGLGRSRIIIGDKAALVADLKAVLAAGDWVLVKGSRGAAMETVAKPIAAWAASRPDGR